MTEVINVSKHNKKPSEELTAAIEMLSFQTIRAAEAFDKVKKLAEEEGITDDLLKELIIKSLKKRKLSDRTIFRYLPAELKTVRKLSSSSANLAVVEDKKRKVDSSSSRQKVIEVPTTTTQIETKDDWKPPIPSEEQSVSYYQAKIDSLEAENTELKKVIEERNSNIEKLSNLVQSLETQVQYYKELAQSNSKHNEKEEQKEDFEDTEAKARNGAVEDMKHEIKRKEKELSETEDKKEKIALQADIRDLKLRISMLSRK